MKTSKPRSFIFAVTLLAVTTANSSAGEDKADAVVLAVADQALEYISGENMEGLISLMLPDGMSYSSGLRDGAHQVRARTTAESLESGFSVEINERGFDPTVLVSGPVAMVWYPYDIYVDGGWSHCGVDIFSMLLTDEGWRISSITWSVEQPPECLKHPDGPPAD